MGGSDLNVLFLDTEGLGSTIRGSTYDCRIFALSLLLSSYFVYNSVGVIDGDAISRLGLVVNLTKHIQVPAHFAARLSKALFCGTPSLYRRAVLVCQLDLIGFGWRVQVRATVEGAAGSGSGGEADSEEADLFPNFLWVVRDFGVRLERNGVQMSSREYLEDALKAEAGTSDATEQKNAVRGVLRRFFPQRDCVTMVRQWEPD